MTEHSLTSTRELLKSAGFDLRSSYEITVAARGKVLIKTDLQMKLTEGCYSRNEPRTDLVLFHHLEIRGVTEKTMSWVPVTTA